MSAGEEFESNKMKMEIDDISDKEHDSDKSSDSEDESSDAMSVNDEELEKEAANLEKKIEDNPYDYNAYVELIKQLQKMTELERLRKVRENMSKHFPLTSELWMSWLKEEINLAASDTERKSVIQLFDRAVQDYLSVELWLEYAQFSIGNMGLQDGVKTVRDTFERSLTAGGLHVAKGAILWEAYREFENVMLGMLQAKSEADMSDAQREELNAQKKRLVTLFRRQLACPLLDMEKTYQEFNEWLNEEPNRKEGVDIKNIESGFKKALLRLSKILPFEEKLLSTEDANKAVHYQAYLEHEKSHNEPARVQCLYERAVADLCLDATIWLEYVQYLDTTLKIDSVVLPVCRRAVRNCPWNSALWQYYIRALERYNKPFEEVKEVMEQALSVGFTSAEDYRSIWLCYIEYMRRRVDWKADDNSTSLTELRATFNRACEHLAQYFGLQGDPNCDILQYWARIEAAHCKNFEKFRLLWTDILSMGHDKTASMWLEYIRLERTYGDDKHLRRLFPRALMSTQDWPESIGSAWLNYERDEGTLESYEFCMSKYKSRMKQITERREKQAAKETETSGKGKQDKGKKQSTKKKNETEGKWAGVAPKSVISKTDSKPETTSKMSSVLPPPGFEKQKKSEDKTEGPPVKKQKTEETSDSEHGVTVAHDSSKDDRTVFVSNLNYSVTEEKIREVFSTLGTLTDLRLVKDFKGRSKGYCYVEFSSIRTTAELDWAHVRPMYVSKCDSDKQTRKPAFKYSTSFEKNKTFLKRLPRSTTKEELEEIFKAYGSLKDVRIVTYRNGHSKGLAYVEFNDETAAAHALIKTDGMTVGDRTISVALSKPPDRKQTAASFVPSSVSASQVPSSLGGGTKQLGPRGRGRTQVSFLPRSLQVPSTSTTSSAAATNKTTSNGSETNGDNNAGGDAKKPMSNSDFRQMLLGNK
ncbi:hypothetical protein L9F63_006937 [Diploptera punctata]|uniref:RRM domain-containing protein n=1 Tax=Diploptera punctata TaxID=6984 RepID=A0AAD7Z929_DIPPU|nr:hypothetical protein L9F63_006937 [Diploptera punctata]